MRKWIMSACVALAWSIFIVPLLAVAVSRGPAQAKPSTVSVIQTARVTPATPQRPVRDNRVQPNRVQASTAKPATWTVQPGNTLSGIAAALAVPGGWQALYSANRRAIGPDANTIRPGTVLVLPQRQPSARYTVAPGDTLSGIAAALAVPGGWQALYAANRQAIGPNPNVIRPGVVLMSPSTSTRVSPPLAAPGPRHQAPSPVPASTPSAQPTTPAGSATATAERPAAPAGRPAGNSGGSMPRWLEDVLLVVGVLAVTAFASEPVAIFTRRRRQAARLAGRQPRKPARRPGLAQCAVARARIILADHERLIVTYSTLDDTVYVLTPPGEDPRAVLRAARLVLPESTYGDLADHLGVPAAWPFE